LNKSFEEIIKYLEKFDIKVESNFSDNEIIIGIGSIDSSNSNQITFFDNYKLLDSLSKTKAKGCIINKKNIDLLPHSCTPIIVEDPYLAFAHLTNLFYPSKISKGFIDTNCEINTLANIGSNVEIHKFVVIKEDTFIDDNAIILNNSSIGPNVKIGKNTTICSNNTISNAIIGNNCLIQSGCVIGDKGFGFSKKEKVKINHIGNVLIGNNVEIGSNTTIDKASLDSTIIRDNVRIDNLVQIAHSVTIGNNTIIASQVGIAGSSIIGDNCLIGGQAGISGHLKIGNNVTIAAKSGVTKNINDNLIVAGFPAINIKKWKKNIINQYKQLK